MHINKLLTVQIWNDIVVNIRRRLEWIVTVYLALDASCEQVTCILGEKIDKKKPGIIEFDGIDK